MPEKRILITGANGQIGTALSIELRKIYGSDNVICTDIKKPITTDGPFYFLDILNKQRLREQVNDLGITDVYHLAAILSANGEWNPKKTWNINLNGLLSLLNLAEKGEINKIFFPSTIAVFGEHTPRVNTSQYEAMDPTTVYGMSKVAGELWCNYFHKRYGTDVRSVRYPGIIGSETIPMGGTTDYAVEIYHEALKTGSYTCFLSENTRLPMMYMPDAIRATLELMQVPVSDLTVRAGYNLSAMSFSPSEIAEEIKKHVPSFEIKYEPDFRDEIANTWCESIDDSQARADWNWIPEYDLEKMSLDMITKLKPKYEKQNI